MFRIIQLSAIMVTLTMCKPSDLNVPFTETILIDTEYLAKTKNRIKENDTAVKYAFEKLILDAEKALLAGPFSVTDKKKLPPSGDKHDYASYSRYWWPDPNQPDGMPYIRKDGETNPDSQNPKTSDRQRIGAFGLNTETLGLAFHFTGDEKYAIKASELLRTWFINEATKMNPNVNHSQCRPGHNQGSKSGILDGRLLIRALEGALLISESSALSKKEMGKLKIWAREYFQWLTTNEMALAESVSKNNHGSFYDAQAIYFALFSDNKNAAKKIAKQFLEQRVNLQIQKDGSMPEEISRTRPLFYSIYNLHAMFIVAHLAEKVDIDIWKAKDKDSRLKSGLDYLLPYTDSNAKWPYPTIGEADRMRLLPILKMAKDAYPNEKYTKMENYLPMEGRRENRAQLVYPLMR